MKNIVSFLLLIPATAFAAAGFAERYYDHQHWILPAYAYCFGFGLVTLLILIMASLLFKAKTKNMAIRASTFLKDHPVCGIIVAGILWAILLGIAGAVSWEIIWFLTILPLLEIMVCFPLALAKRRIREERLLSPSMLKWAVMIVMSAIIASVLFIVFTDCGVLKGTEITYLARPNRFHPDGHYSTHPYDSMKEIWGMPLLFMAEIIIAIFLYYLGMIVRHVWVKFLVIRNKKRLIKPVK